MIPSDELASGILGGEAQDTRPEVGRTGARFGSRRTRKAKTDEHPPPSEPEVAAPDDVEETTPLPRIDDDNASAWAAAVRFNEPEEAAEDVSIVRPYARTGGRTKPSYELRLETLLSAEGQMAERRVTEGEHRLIVELCSVPRSVAEVAAALSVPLGVAKVMLADLIGIGLVTPHIAAGAAPDGTPDLPMLERVLAGLRRL